MVSIHLCLHHHQPVGNPDEVLEEIYENCYRPLLETLSFGSETRFNLSYSGFLLRFLEKCHPEYLDRLRGLVDDGRVELLASGFYGPILADLSPEDRDGQLELSQRWFFERFGVEPKGVWLSEAVWDKALIGAFRSRQLEYTIVRDERFIQTGLSRADLHGYWITEELGRTLALFPSSEEVQARIPFGSPEEWEGYFRRMANRTRICLSLGDMAERWGAWPGTHGPLYEQGKLRQLVDFFERSSDWLKLRLFCETLESQAPQGRCYLPAGANSDLGAWSLPDHSRSRYYEAHQDLERRHDAARFLPFFRAGCWENFKERYPESNLMNKKGLWLKRQLKKKEQRDPVSQDWLWQAQCNTAYWHGSYGGIYFPHLREAIWKRLLATQRRLELAGKELIREDLDVDGDGLGEHLVYSRSMHIGVSPARGGTLFEWSDLDALHNFSNTLTRQRESTPVTSQDEDMQFVNQTADPYPLGSFHDHIVSKKMAVHQIREGKISDRADWTGRRFKVVLARRNKRMVELTLEGQGFIEQGGVERAVRLRKTFLILEEGRRIEVTVALTNEGKSPLEGVYALEGNLSLAPHQESVLYSIDGEKEKLLDDGIAVESIRRVQWGDVDKNCKVVMESREPMLLWAAPLETLGMNKGESQRLCQGHSIWTGWSFWVPAGGERTFCISWQTQNVHHKKVD